MQYLVRLLMRMAGLRKCFINNVFNKYLPNGIMNDDVSCLEMFDRVRINIFT
jgi:hypothetical protein